MWEPYSVNALLVDFVISKEKENNNSNSRHLNKHTMKQSGNSYFAIEKTLKLLCATTRPVVTVHWHC